MRFRSFAVAALMGFITIGPSLAQDPLKDGALLIHGNYCGPGNRGFDKRPVDALDAACRHHDRCTPDGRLPSCACNARLAREAAQVARDRRQPHDLRVLADVVANAAKVPICRP